MLIKGCNCQDWYYKYYWKECGVGKSLNCYDVGSGDAAGYIGKVKAVFPNSCCCSDLVYYY